MNQTKLKKHLETVVTEQTDTLYRLAFSYVKNEQDAMDVVQDSVCKALQRLGSIRQPEYLSTWLCRIVINTSLDFVRKRSREIVGVPELESGKEDSYGALEIDSLLSVLDEKSRTILALHFCEDFTLVQVAEILQENLSTVKTRMYKALRILKKELDAQEVNYGS